MRLPCSSPCRSDGCLHAGEFFRSQIQETSQSPGIVSPPPPFHRYYLGVFHAICTFNDFFFGFPSSWVTTWRASLLRWWRGFHRFLHSHQEPMRSTVKMFGEAPINIGPKPPHLGDFLPLPAYHKHHALVALILTVTQMDISCLLLSLLTSFTFPSVFFQGFWWTSLCSLPWRSPNTPNQSFLRARKNKLNPTLPPWRTTTYQAMEELVRSWTSSGCRTSLACDGLSFRVVSWRLNRHFPWKEVTEIVG